MKILSMISKLFFPKKPEETKPRYYDGPCDACLRDGLPCSYLGGCGQSAAEEKATIRREIVAERAMVDYDYDGGAIIIEEDRVTSLASMLSGVERTPDAELYLSSPDQYLQPHFDGISDESRRAMAESHRETIAKKPKLYRITMSVEARPLDEEETQAALASFAESRKKNLL